MVSPVVSQTINTSYRRLSVCDSPVPSFCEVQGFHIVSNFNETVLWLHYNHGYCFASDMLTASGQLEYEHQHPRRPGLDPGEWYREADAQPSRPPHFSVAVLMTWKPSPQRSVCVNIDTEQYSISTFSSRWSSHIGAYVTVLGEWVLWLVNTGAPVSYLGENFVRMFTEDPS